MKTVIAGSRIFENPKDASEVLKLIEDCPISFEITEVVSGTAKGVDRIGEFWANTGGIPVKQFRADWNTHGRAAGPIRNEEMAKYADACIVIWDGKSKGSSNMIKNALKHKLKLYTYIIDEET